MTARYRICTPALPGAPKLILLLLLAPAIGAISDDELPWTAVEQPLDGAIAVEQPRPAGDPESLEKEVALLTSRVGSALSTEQHLTAENAELRKEVDGWAKVGQKVMKREAQIIEAIKQSHDLEPGQPSLRAEIANLMASEPEKKPALANLMTPEPEKQPALALAGRSSVVAETNSSVVAKTKSADHLSPTLISWKIFVLAFTVLATAALCWARAPAIFSGLLGKEKFLELSELQLEGVPMGFGEGYLLVQSSGGLRSRTRVAEQMEDSSILRFDEVMPITLRKREGPCVITVFRRDELQDVRIGTATLGASDMPGRNSEVQYFRFKVQPDRPLPKQELHIAMRIRDVTAAPRQSKARTKSPAFCV